MFGSPTPESNIARSDSKNPANTCKGITSTGRPCRRALGASAGLLTAVTKENGVLAILDEGDAAAFFCWQHKQQAAQLATRSRERTTIVPLKGRSSLDELAERVGILDLEEDVIPTSERGERLREGRGGAKVCKRENLPPPWQKMQSPIMSVSRELKKGYNAQVLGATRSYHTGRPERHSYTNVRRSNVKAMWGCCIQADDDDEPLPARRRRRRDAVSQHTNLEKSKDTSQQKSTTRHEMWSTDLMAANPRPMQNKHYSGTSERQDNRERVSPSTPKRPQLKPKHFSSSPPNSQTMEFMSYIPPHLSPSTTAALLAELTRPISEADEEGYIYIFWLTPESDSTKPDDETASQLLDYDDYRYLDRLGNARTSSRPGTTLNTPNDDSLKTAQFLRRYASVRRNPREPEKILVKIGRATNVHRRLSQWTKQCGQNLTLIRYYPYNSTSKGGSSKSTMHKLADKQTVPHVHRVERLIHIELGEKKVTDKDGCKTCGKVHKEWFEVEATRQGLQDVDEVIRRWVKWSQTYESRAA